MSALLVAPLALPLTLAAVLLLVRRYPTVQRAISFSGVTGLVAVGISLVAATSGGTVHATRVGGWPGGLAIPFVADGTAALLVAAASMVSLLCLVTAAARGEDHHPLFHPLVAVLLAGVLGSFTTGDLFNLFVTFEVMLIASYVLLALRGGTREVRASTVYVTVNLLASALLLIGIALLYGAAGTVELAALHGVVADVPGAVIGATLVAVAVAIKASLVPVHSWLPRVYPVAGPATTALFSALLTKAGVYVLLRLDSTVFAGIEGFRQAVLVAAVVTMVIGVLGAVGRGDVRGILSFHMVSQVGYLVLPIGIGTVAGYTAGLVYLLQYLAVKGSLFLSAAAIETLTGTGQLARLGGMLRTRPALAIGFLLPALSLAGIPPTSGFVGKFLLVTAAFDERLLWAGGIAVAVSFATLLSMLKIWNGVFWGERTTEVTREPGLAAFGMAIPAGGAGGDDPAVPRGVRTPRTIALAAPALLVGALVLALGVLAGPLVDLVQPAAETLADPQPYLDAVREA
ncbi:complex I subunit 5 family protein [Nitriliruptor alkaliphilus]|uniref:complex I subunit 5 family protein n=1 Tax=Nitriliruptor alkaliphilus TaxID=427918 RepID=UPI000696AEC4|nr:proton-conducting transporter membrane subunit [Nitriliruptor alkaliphilus]